MRAVLAVLCLVLLAAGCLQSVPVAPVVPEVDPAPASPVLAYTSVAGVVTNLTIPAILGRATLHPVGAYTTEPGIAVTADGTLFVIAGEEVMRSQDDGATWQEVHSYATARDQGLPPTLDPWIWADPITNRVYTDHLTLACTTTAWSDDVGDSWSPEWPLACGAPLTDFQKLVTGPPGPVVNSQAGVLYPTVVYLCYNKFVGDFVTGAVPAGTYGLACAVSYDGGMVWQNEARLTRVVEAAGTTTGDCGGGAWIPAVAPDGTVVVRSQPDCLFRTRDSGASWQTIGTGPDFEGTMMAFDDAGTLYALSAWWDPPLRVSLSRDQGETWEAPFVVQAPGTHGVSLPTLVAGAAGKLFVPYWATSEPLDSAMDATETTRWDAWLVTVDGAHTPDPTMVAYRANAADAPMHIGSPVRGVGPFFLGDFVTATIGPDGTPYVVFPQTCNDGCQAKDKATEDDLEQLGTVVALRGWPMR